MLVKHQKLATLSSNIPRAKGKMRDMAAKNVENDENGGRNGENRMMNENSVIAARRINS